MRNLKKKIKSNLIKYKFGYIIHKYYSNLNIKPTSYPIKDIIICGIQRSGSTLVYNYTKELIEYKNKNIDTFFSFDIQYKNLLKNEYSSLIKKTHTYTPYISRRIKKKQSIGIFTYRDIRDILVSAIQKGWINSYNDWIRNNGLNQIIFNALLFAETPNIIKISYQELIDNPEIVIKTIASNLDLIIDQDEIIRIIDKYSIPSVKNKISQIPANKKLEYSDQFHKNHIYDAKTGKWKDYFSDSDIKIINNYCKRYLEYFNYPL
jgi:hypothetical protein